MNSYITPNVSKCIFKGCLNLYFSPSARFLQTKWKNIRYNYLQEQKCIETGTINTNIRKRRFTEDLSFLKHTAFRKEGPAPIKSNYNGSYVNLRKKSINSYNF